MCFRGITGLLLLLPAYNIFVNGHCARIHAYTHRKVEKKNPTVITACTRICDRWKCEKKKIRKKGRKHRRSELIVNPHRWWFESSLKQKNKENTHAHSSPPIQAVRTKDGKYFCVVRWHESEWAIGSECVYVKWEQAQKISSAKCRCENIPKKINK